MSDAPALPRSIRFVGEATTPVPLADPVEVDGATVAEVHVAKLTVGAYRRHTEAGGKSDVLALPMFSLDDGTPVPADVMDALSFRDAQTLTEVASGFFECAPEGRGARVRFSIVAWRPIAAVVMRTMPGITLGDVLAMDWPELVTWWNIARGMLEGPPEPEG